MVLIAAVMKPFPKEVHAEEGMLTVLWNDGHKSIYSGRNLRMACRCAACVDEWTHKNLIQQKQIPPVVKPSRIEAVGSYALHIFWDDGHSTGLFSYDSLRELCECSTCRPDLNYEKENFSV